MAGGDLAAAGAATRRLPSVATPSTVPRSGSITCRPAARSRAAYAEHS
jgi:hypothetical protein